jgi:hypothetical protein
MSFRRNSVFKGLIQYYYYNKIKEFWPGGAFSMEVREDTSI